MLPYVTISSFIVILRNVMLFQYSASAIQIYHLPGPYVSVLCCGKHSGLETSGKFLASRFSHPGSIFGRE